MAGNFSKMSNRELRKALSGYQETVKEYKTRLRATNLTAVTRKEYEKTLTANEKMVAKIQAELRQRPF